MSHDLTCFKRFTLAALLTEQSMGKQGHKLRDDPEDKSQEGEDGGLPQVFGSQLLRIG